MKKPSKISLVLALCLLGGGNHAFAAEEKDATDIIRALEQHKDISKQLVLLAELKDEQLGHRKIQPLLLNLVQDNGLSKSERLEVFKIVAELSVSREVLNQDEAAEAFLKIEPQLSSPNLKLLCIETLLSFDALKNSGTESKIAKLVQTIIADASLDVGKQKYPATLHAACLKSLDGSKASSNQISNIEKLLASESSLSPTLRMALYEVIGTISEAKPGALKKSTKNTFAKSLSEILSTQPALAQIGASESEIQSLKVLIPALGLVLADEDNSSYADKAMGDLLKGFRHKDLDVVRLSGQALTAIVRGHGSKSKFELDKETLNCIGELDLKAEDAVNREGLYLGVLGASLECLLTIPDMKSADSRIESVINHCHRTVMTHANIDIRIKAMDVLFVIEPLFFEGKLLNTASRKVLKTFVSDCASAMDNAQLKQGLPSLLQRMTEVLHEITGRDFGSDSKLWNDWLRKEGKDFF
jgi:hypothetical protein